MIDSLIHWLIHWFIDSLIHWVIRWFIDWLIDCLLCSGGHPSPGTWKTWNVAMLEHAATSTTVIERATTKHTNSNVHFTVLLISSSLTDTLFCSCDLVLDLDLVILMHKLDLGILKMYYSLHCLAQDSIRFFVNYHVTDLWLVLFSSTDWLPNKLTDRLIVQTEHVSHEQFTRSSLCIKVIRSRSSTRSQEQNSVSV